MSKSAVVAIVASVFVVGLLLGLFILPGLTAMQSGQSGKEAAQKAVPSTVSQTLQPIVKEEAQKAASDMAAKMVVRPSDSDIDIQPVAKPDPSSAPVVVTRASFGITLPPGSTVKPDNPKYGPDRLVGCRLPGGASLNILLVDDKADAASTAVSALDGIRGAMKDSTTNHESALGWMNVVGVNGIEGTIEGERFAFETGYSPGTVKACVLIVEYPMDSEKKQAAIDSIQHAISTLTMKD